MCRFLIEKAEAIAKAVADYRKDYPNNTGFTRKCVLNMETMVNLLLSMQGGSLKKELYDAGIDVTASAFVQQRNKIPWTVFEDTFEHFNADCNDVNPLYDVLNKTYTHCIIPPQPKMDEVGCLAFYLSWYDFKEKTLIVADRGYESYNAFAHFLEHPNVDFLIRVKQDRTAMREIGKLPMTELDVDVSFTITTTQTKIDKENGYILVQTRKN